MERFGYWAVATFIAGIAMLAAARRLFFRGRQRSDSFIPTALKAVDLFAPLPRGGDVLFTDGDGAGSVILGYEVARRLLEHPTDDFHVLFFLDEGLPDLSIRTAEMDEILPALTHRYTVATVTEADFTRHQLDSASKHAVIFVASDNQRFLQIFRDAIRHVRRHSSVAKRLTTVTVTGCSPISDFDATIECSQMIAEQGIFPAIDPGASHSSVYNDSAVLTRQQ